MLEGEAAPVAGSLDPVADAYVAKYGWRLDPDDPGTASRAGTPRTSGGTSRRWNLGE